VIRKITGIQYHVQDVIENPVSNLENLDENKPMKRLSFQKRRKS